jgi:heme/copper-type cytochrome/quinol oxidase subunit 3
MRSRALVDVSRLPTATFGPRDLMWWGTAGFVAIEGTTLFICVATYFYLRFNFLSWPPEHTLRPSLLWPTIQAALMLASNGPNYLLQRSARALDLAAVRKWVVVEAVLSVVFVALRWQEFLSLNVRWDANAYGSIAWATVGFHATLLLLQMVETMVFGVFLYGDKIEEKHFSDAYDSAFYWYFMTGSWVVLYAIVFLSPYLM